MLDQIFDLASAPTSILDVGGATPTEAIRRLKRVLPVSEAERTEWAKRARIAAVMGSCPRSRASFKSGGFGNARVFLFVASCASRSQ